MNDLEIRESFHQKKLQRYHTQKNTIVIDELGLNHGKNRADIAVVNGHFVGYEIKSDNDSLRRIKKQIKSYNSVFDKISVVVGERHIDTIQNHVPQWWGIILSVRGPKGAINFNTVRKAQINKKVKPISLARLLWRDEAHEILRQKNLPPRILRQPRAILYEYLVNKLDIFELKKFIKKCFTERENWRCLELPSQCDGSFQPVPTS